MTTLEQAAVQSWSLLRRPVSVATAAGEVTLALARLLAPEGMVGRLERMTQDPESPLGRIAELARAAAPDRPLGRAMAPGGMLDRALADDGPVARLLAAGGPIDRVVQPGGLLERLLRPGGPVDQLMAEDGPLERLLAPGGALDRVTEVDGVLDHVLSEGGLLDRILVEEGFVEKLVADGGTLDQLVELGVRLEMLQPRLAELIEAVPELRSSIDVLGDVVEPLAGLANRLPGGRKRSAVGA